MIRKKIYLLLLLIPLLHGCKESDFNDLLDRQGDQRKELQELTDLCKKLNEDIYNLRCFFYRMMLNCYLSSNSV